MIWSAIVFPGGVHPVRAFGGSVARVAEYREWGDGLEAFQHLERMERRCVAWSGAWWAVFEDETVIRSFEMP